MSFLSGSAGAGSRENSKHRHAGKHSHGHAEISIAFDGLKGELTMKGAAEPILGFESFPKNEQQKSKVESTKKLFQAEAGNFFSFDKNLGCNFTVKKLEQVKEAEDDDHGMKDQAKKAKGKKNEEHSGLHTDWEASFAIECQKSPLGSDLKVDLTKFDKLKDVDITLLMDSFQKTFEYKGKPATFSLK